SENTELIALANDQVVFRAGLLKGTPGRDHLAYRVEVVNEAVSIREFVFVDARNGQVIDQITGIYHGVPAAPDREVSESSLASVVWDESAGDPDPITAGWAGGTVQQVIDWQEEIDGALETYHLFGSMTGGSFLSYDGVGATMRTVNNDPGISCPNANWNGLSTNYCTGVTGDDTVAHEWGHAYTDFTSDLIYQWQTGALNESYSDIWGEVVDFLNGRGTDSPIPLRTAGNCSIYGAGAPSVDDSYRWLSGEDDPAFGGAIRDMWDPTCYGSPGKVSDSEYWCTTGDFGGVHFNSGVPNHAFALMVDGGTYNGETVSSLGLTKASHIHWGAQNLLTATSNFADHADALEAACSALVGVNLPTLSTSTSSAGLSGMMITAGDCTEVADAIAAVEFRDPPTQCNFMALLDPEAPALCEGLGSVETIAFEDFEGGSLPAGWSASSHDVASPGTFDNPGWSIEDSLPSGANGSYAAFAPDLAAGDCVTDIEAGAVALDSAEIVLPADTVPHVAFDHWVSTEAGWDGGNVKVKVNGRWKAVPSAAYSFNAYNDTLVGGGSDNPLADQDAFTGADGGSLGGSWGQSQIDLYGLALPGDTVQLRFDLGVDGCGGTIGWYVDDVHTYSCSAEVPPICGDGALDLGEMCDDGNTDNGDGCSATCGVESGWLCTDPTPGVMGVNVVADPSFEAGAFGGTWTESSLNFGTPICDVGSCGTGTGTGPSDGSFWTWFGGIGAYEAGSVSQSVTIPATATDLTFDLEQIICDHPADYMEVVIDGNVEFLSDGSSGLCGSFGYSQQVVDVSGYADGGTYTLEFRSEIFGNNGAGTNFFVDNIELSDNLAAEGTPSTCIEIVEDVSCNGGIVDFADGIPSGWQVKDYEGNGVVWTDMVSSGLGANFTAGDGDAASVSSDEFAFVDFDTALITNPFSLETATSASLDYLVNYQNLGGLDFLDVDISTNGGASWTTLLSWNEDHPAGGLFTGPGESVSLNLSAYAGESEVLVRWRYYDPNDDDWDWYAQIDNVSVVSGEDADCDGIVDTQDYCPGTVIPEATVPVRRLRGSRTALVDGDGEFDSWGAYPPPGFTLEDTAG
ncbi:MAG: M4 family metallopeptidase, partial [Acidimicrobiia bacterium]